MQVKATIVDYVDVDPLHISRALLNQFLDMGRSDSCLIAIDVKKEKNKYFIFKNSRYFDNSSKEEKDRELTHKEYEYFLALKTIIEYQKELKKDDTEFNIRDEMRKLYYYQY